MESTVPEVWAHRAGLQNDAPHAASTTASIASVIASSTFRVRVGVRAMGGIVPEITATPAPCHAAGGAGAGVSPHSGHAAASASPRRS